jgi:hypothetical protein
MFFTRCEGKKERENRESREFKYLTVHVSY